MVRAEAWDRTLMFVFLPEGGASIVAVWQDAAGAQAVIGSLSDLGRGALPARIVLVVPDLSG